MTIAQPGRRRLDTSVPTPYEVATREPRVASRRWSRLLILATFVLWVLSTAGAATSIADVNAPSWLWRPSAAALLVAFSLILTHRVGGYMRIWVSLAIVLAALAVVTEVNGLLAAAAGATAVLSAVTSVVFTRPADSLLEVLREYVVMLSLALSGAAGVAAWNATVEVRPFGLMVMAVSVTLAVAIVWRLGSGLHGLGRNQLKILIVVAVLAVGLFYYGSFVRTAGSPALKNLLDDTIVWLRQNIGGVPRPYEFLIGFPALVVGTSMRSRYREGWWVCVFAVVGTVIVANSLIDPRAYPSYFALSTLYSAIIGLVLGLVVRAVFFRPRGGRAARAVQQSRRSEPKRLAPLR
ncbi:hypothetical protein AFL01nite_11820 [Aeromicrobium flavum]|uniref:Uncharacterized protein n=1 Tax=Aeromicrobium flavum TaxID=416568 RepID=A0A512HTT5_9ACTN|nr:hypothetical protein [Aeromicrobium flavum]GEO88855.1 hypothetical protein AFL01nite_11820 [Aeromicrobium flavum]